MNRNLIQVVLSQTNNLRLFQILNLKKLNEHDYLLPKMIKFKKYSYPIRSSKCYEMEEIIWLSKFTFYDIIFYNFTLKTKLNNRQLDIIKLNSLIYNGKLDIIKFLYKTDSYFLSKIILWAIDYLHIYDIPFFEIQESKNNFEETIAKNQYFIFRWLLKHIKNINTIETIDIDTFNCIFHNMIIAAATFKDLKFIKYVFRKAKERFLTDIKTVLEDITYFGYLDTLKWYYKKIPEKIIYYNSEILKIAITNGHLYIIMWLFDTVKLKIPSKSKYKKTLISLAKKYNYQNIIAFLHAQ